MDLSDDNIGTFIYNRLSYLPDKLASVPVVLKTFLDLSYPFIKVHYLEGFLKLTQL